MIITDLYETKMECSNYNVNIDDNTVTVTVTLKDFNGAVVTGKTVTLSVDRGYFTKCVGTGTQNITNTTTKSVTGITNNNGQIVATWTASEWGLCTFSANNTKIQVNVNGSATYTYTDFKNTHITVSSSYFKFNRSGHIVTCVYHLTGGGGAFTESTFADISNSSIPERYIPTVAFMEEVLDTSHYRTGGASLGVIKFDTDGKLQMELISKSAFNFQGTITYYVD